MKAIALFGKMLAFSRLKINTNNLVQIHHEVATFLKKSTGSVPVVIDSSVDLDLVNLVDMLWALGIQPIGVIDGVLSEQAIKMRLAILPADGQRIETLKPEKSADSIAINETPSQDNLDTPTKNTSVRVMNNDQDGLNSCICDGMLRSGQSFQHLGGDLVILGGVNWGAEAITDSNLHVYGRGFGRLVAGAMGDKKARIFCQRFNPSLVSVAGTYCLRDDIPEIFIDKAVQVSYDEKEGLAFTLMEN